LKLPSNTQVAPLVVRSGSASWVIPSFAKEVNAKALHVISPDVVTLQRQSQKVFVAALEDMGVEIWEWQRCLRPTAPWEDDKSRLPKIFGNYCALADELPVAKPEVSFRSMLSKRTRPASYENPPFYAERFVPPPPPPNIMEEDNPALAKYLGLDDSKSLFTDGEVYTWGRGDDGRLGHGDNGWKYVPRIIGTTSLHGQVVIQVTCGSYHTAAVCSNGDLYTWGGGMYGKLGHGNESGHSTPNAWKH